MKIETTIDEGTVHLVCAAYRIGKGDASAVPPTDLLYRCVKLIRADTDEESDAIIASAG